MSVQKPHDKKIATKKRFLEAAAKIFSEKGFQSANVSDIVSAVKSGQGTFYYHFKDKQAIFDEILIDFINKLAVVIIENEARANGRLALADRALAIDNARRIASVFMENIDVAKLFFSESRYVGGEAMKRLDALNAALAAQIENGIRMGLAAGMVRPDVEPRTAALCFAGAAEKVISDAVRNKTASSNLDSLAAQIVDFQSYGILIRDSASKVSLNSTESQIPEGRLNGGGSGQNNL
ncbi:MAG TPA: TetR/AcrR family transcriptional regulator [bacterium]|nr:MAG: HTH-type transcriptional regulator AcrR [bacterium ADurb.Bin236]HOY62586.1 TetR/AcrR family transcriptional regulator [bacterium]HPI76172.1 TetR/AcrR family transcriptional regulator [bacterium]HPN95474.1 TetR/AcrR family transcriptional regulator [bacterium]